MNNESYEYNPSQFTAYSFEDVLSEIKDHAIQSDIKIFGKIFKTPRFGVFVTDDIKIYSYSSGALPSISWKDCPNIYGIKKCLEAQYVTRIGGCLAQIYRDGNDYVSWHHDEDAMSSDYEKNYVFSVSFGAPRKFVWREKKNKKIKYEKVLSDGDLFVMKKDFQMIYQHTLPKTKKCQSIRINLTFRAFE